MSVICNSNDGTYTGWVKTGNGIPDGQPDDTIYTSDEGKTEGNLGFPALPNGATVTKIGFACSSPDGATVTVYQSDGTEIGTFPPPTTGAWVYIDTAYYGPVYVESTLINSVKGNKITITEVALFYSQPPLVLSCGQGSIFMMFLPCFNPKRLNKKKIHVVTTKSGK